MYLNLHRGIGNGALLWMDRCTKEAGTPGPGCRDSLRGVSEAFGRRSTARRQRDCRIRTNERQWAQGNCVPSRMDVGQEPMIPPATRPFPRTFKLLSTQARGQRHFLPLWRAETGTPFSSAYRMLKKRRPARGRSPSLSPCSKGMKRYIRRNFPKKADADRKLECEYTRLTVC